MPEAEYDARNPLFVIVFVIVLSFFAFLFESSPPEAETMPEPKCCYFSMSLYLFMFSCFYTCVLSACFFFVGGWGRG